MMKTNHKGWLRVAGLILLFLVIGGSASADSIAEYLKPWGVGRDSNARQEKNMVIGGKDVHLTYKSTSNASEKRPTSWTDYYGARELYLDEERNTYEFAWGTDTLVSYIGRLAEPVHITSEQEARTLADGFMKQFIDRHQDYIFVMAQKEALTGDKSNYSVYYCKFIGGYMTNDYCSVVLYDQESSLHIIASMHNRYDEYLDKKYDIAEAQHRMKRLLEEKQEKQPMYDVKIRGDCIAMDDSGKLSLRYFVTYYEKEKHAIDTPLFDTFLYVPLDDLEISESALPTPSEDAAKQPESEMVEHTESE